MPQLAIGHQRLRYVLKRRRAIWGACDRAGFSNTEESDIDLMVRPLTSASFVVLPHLKADLDLLLGGQVHLVPAGLMRPEVRREAERDAIAIRPYLRQSAHKRGS
jgi:predicted nucleotidyltransferase